jgi:hypothetical protein
MNGGYSLGWMFTKIYTHLRSLFWVVNFTVGGWDYEWLGFKSTWLDSLWGLDHFRSNHDLAQWYRGMAL